jgi:sugar (pentulose or hexulose) kinase
LLKPFFDAGIKLKAVGLAEYPILTPRLGYAEQDPEHWWRATVAAVREALDKAEGPEILGIGFSGQMHGLVLLDRSKRLLRPAIIWADQRSADLLPEIDRTRRAAPASATMRHRTNGRFCDRLAVLAAKI